MSTNKIQITGKVLKKGAILTFPSGNRIIVTISTTNKVYLVQAWDQNCIYVENNIKVGDLIHISGELVTRFDKKTKSTIWYIKAKKVEPVKESVNISGVVTNTRCTRAGHVPDNYYAISLRTDIPDSNIVYCIVPKRYEKYLFIGRKITVIGDPYLTAKGSDYIRLRIIVDNLELLN